MTIEEAVIIIRDESNLDKDHIELLTHVLTAGSTNRLRNINDIIPKLPKVLHAISTLLYPNLPLDSIVMTTRVIPFIATVLRHKKHRLLLDALIDPDLPIQMTKLAKLYIDGVSAYKDIPSVREKYFTTSYIYHETMLLNHVAETGLDSIM